MSDWYSDIRERLRNKGIAGYVAGVLLILFLLGFTVFMVFLACRALMFLMAIE